jgi:hypothetical protein
MNMQSDKYCVECGVEPCNLHKVGCWHEECPICFGQIVSCPCSRHYFGLSAHPASKEDLNDAQTLEWANIISQIGRLKYRFFDFTEDISNEAAGYQSELLDVLIPTLAQEPSSPPNPAIKCFPSATIDNLLKCTLTRYDGYEGRNPRTGEKVIVPARFVPSISATETLTEFMNAKSRRDLEPSSELCKKVLETLQRFDGRLVDLNRHQEIPGLGEMRVAGRFQKDGQIEWLFRFKFCNDFINIIQDRCTNVYGDAV